MRTVDNLVLFWYIMSQLSKTLFLGKVNEVQIDYKPHEFTYDEPYETRSEQYRHDKMSNADVQWKVLRDGFKYHIESILVDAWWIWSGIACATSYRKIAYQESLSKESEWLDMRVPQCLFVAGLIETKDDQFVFWVRSNLYLNRKKWSITSIWGMVERIQGDVITLQAMEKQMYEELKEEIGYTGDVLSSRCIWCIENERRNIWFIFHIVLPLTLEELLMCFSQQWDKELDALIWIHKDDVASVLQERNATHENRLEFLAYILSTKDCNR